MNNYISARSLTKSFAKAPVLDSLDAEVRPGDIVGLLGANGAGKTTLLEVLTGLSPPSAGTAQLFGFDAMNAPVAAKTRIGFVPQTDELLADLRASEYLKLIASFYPGWDHELMRKLVEDWGIDLRKTISTLSVGQRQKLAIISAIAPRPELLILDEPVASLDPLARRKFLQQIVELTADARRAVIFSSHIVSDVERLANIVWILKGGKLIWQGDLDALKESVVRVHVPDSAAPMARGMFRRIATERSANGYTTLVATRGPDEDWSGLAAKLPDAGLEFPSLEEIFLELHS
jgi:ABC-2 type transport system ATP-binding protein